MAKKKKGADAEAGADAAPAKSGKGKSVLMGAGLLLAGAMGQKFVLSSAPAQVIIAPPVDGGVATGGSSSESALDCSAVGTGTAGTAEAASAEVPHAKAAAEAATGGTADLSSMTINLADGRYLKVGITLELGDTVVAEEFSTETAKASDVALNYFSTKSIDQLTSDKHAGIKNELTCLIEAAYAKDDAAEKGAKAEPEPVVVGVLFREFLTS